MNILAFGIGNVAGPDLFIVLLIVFVLFGAKRLQGAKLFALNCFHCHADDATGDEGPDLHGLTKTDERIRTIITDGVKGEMPSFKKKLGDADLAALEGFLRSLK
jgi:mono/diheme cytochrome c family protein